MAKLQKDWPYWHLEKSGIGRIIVHRMDGPWVVDVVERYPELGPDAEQHIQIAPFTDFGMGVVSDGMSQIAERIDDSYTGALMMPTALLAGSRDSWIIGGGCDGPAVREALAWNDTRHVTAVDISPIMTTKTQELIPSFWGGCQDDKQRLTIINRDIYAVLRERKERYQKVSNIVFDLTDPPAPDEYTPFEESTAGHVYSPEGLRLAYDCLQPDGVFVIQAQELSIINSKGHLWLRRMLEDIYTSVHSYRVFIEFFGYWESFIICFKDGRHRSANFGKALPFDAATYDKIIKQYYRGRLAEYYSYESIRGLFSLPKSIRQAFTKAT